MKILRSKSHVIKISTFLFFMLVFLGQNETCAYDSEEHKLVADRGLKRVIIPSSIVLPDDVKFIEQHNYLKNWQAAKRLAVGYATNNDEDYNKREKAQDNCYWYRYGQRKYNMKNWIFPAKDIPDSVLSVPAYVGTEQSAFTFGDLVALYGDFRRTVYCDDEGSKCYLTDGQTKTIHFSGNVIGEYCPKETPTKKYLRYIALGLWPPFGTAGNEASNTAGDQEYSNAGWWGDEMMRLANVNDSHFSNVGVAFYVGMHRLALIYVEKAIHNPKFWVQALHYEARALHSLTDLFAFGHVVTNRDQSSYGAMKNKKLLKTQPNKWMENVIKMGGGNRDENGGKNYPGKVVLTGTLPDITDNPKSKHNDFLKSYLGTWAVWAKREHTYHDYFNNTGAKVRNLNDDLFQIYGDAKLHKTPNKARRVMENAVTSSVQSLFDAYVELKKGDSDINKIGRAGSPYFEALKHVPVYIDWDPDNYFLGRWTLYAKAVNKISGAEIKINNWDTCHVPFLSGKDKIVWPKKHDQPCTSF